MPKRGEKATGTSCEKHPKGLSGQSRRSPFSAAGGWVGFFPCVAPISSTGWQPEPRFVRSSIAPRNRAQQMPDKQEKERPASSPRATEKLTGQGPPGCPDSLRTQDDLNSILIGGMPLSKKTAGDSRQTVAFRQASGLNRVWSPSKRPQFPHKGESDRSSTAGRKCGNSTMALQGHRSPTCAYGLGGRRTEPQISTGCGMVVAEHSARPRTFTGRGKRVLAGLPRRARRR
jgi:hypothetical protein